MTKYLRQRSPKKTQRPTIGPQGEPALHDISPIPTSQSALPAPYFGLAVDTVLPSKTATVGNAVATSEIMTDGYVLLGSQHRSGIVIRVRRTDESNDITLPGDSVLVQSAGIEPTELEHTLEAAQQSQADTRGSVKLIVLTSLRYVVCSIRRRARWQTGVDKGYGPIMPGNTHEDSDVNTKDGGFDHYV